MTFSDLVFRPRGLDMFIFRFCSSLLLPTPPPPPPLGRSLFLVVVNY